jgi:hypothetical protein
MYYIVKYFEGIKHYYIGWHTFSPFESKVFDKQYAEYKVNQLGAMVEYANDNAT